jgi:transducin (beta)-like 1
VDVQVPQSAEDVAAVAEELQHGVFGPLVEHPRRKLEDDDEDEDGEHEEDDMQDENDLPSRKRQTDSRPQMSNGEINGVPAKKPRLSNGYENRAVAESTTPMEVDFSGAGDNNAYPSPLEGEQAPTPAPRTEGPEQGTQVDKVLELTPRTTFLRLTHDDSSPEVATSPTSSVHDTAENAPILLHCEWNPTDPSTLAAAGTDALARVWTISRATTSTLAATTTAGMSNDALPNHVSSITRPGRNLLPASASISVTAMAWNSDGTALAAATDDGAGGRLLLFNAEGDSLVSFLITEPPVLKVRWNPGNSAILAVSPDPGGVLVSVFHLASESSLRYLYTNAELQNYAFDAAWTSESEFLLCGADIMALLRCTESGISLLRKYETRSDDHFTQVLFDWRSKLAATSSDKGVLDVGFPYPPPPCPSTTAADGIIALGRGGRAAIDYGPRRGHNGVAVAAPADEPCRQRTVNRISRRRLRHPDVERAHPREQSQMLRDHGAPRRGHRLHARRCLHCRCHVQSSPDLESRRPRHTPCQLVPDPSPWLAEQSEGQWRRRVRGLLLSRMGFKRAETGVRGK